VDDPSAAATMVERIFRVVHRLARGEFEGPEQRLRSGQFVRSWLVHPVRIHYRRTTDTLQVLRVYHQARRPNTK
jgi:plasmid stabilization system protein ParE